MSFDWLSYLALAKEMNSNIDQFSDQEAVYRAVVSRAYYAVFCQARNYVKEIDDEEFHGNDHQKLQSYLMNHTHRARKKIGNQLRNLHQDRIKADYYDNLDEPSINKAGKAIRQADRIAAGLAEIFS